MHILNVSDDELEKLENVDPIFEIFSSYDMDDMSERFTEASEILKKIAKKEKSADSVKRANADFAKESKIVEGGLANALKSLLDDVNEHAKELSDEVQKSQNVRLDA